MPLPDPVGVQKEVVCLDHAGHAVVLGTAGSGKTTMAIHRAIYLANADTAHGGRTLLLTFNNSLLAYLKFLSPSELQNVDLRTYHRFARGYLHSRGLMTYNAICKPRERMAFIDDALTAVRGELGSQAPLERPSEFFHQEIRWMAQHGLVTEDAYVAADRVGRRTGLPRAQRPVMFKVFERYWQLRRDGFELRYDWDDLAVAAREVLEDDDGEPMYRHIVIDEGQDFSPQMIESLTLAIPEDGSLTFFGDVAQQIYGRRISWRQAGLDIALPLRFERNYRNSPQIARLGLAIAAMPFFGEEPDMVEPTGFAAEGPPPTFVRFGSAAEEAKFVIAQAKAAAEAGASVAVLLRRHEDEPVYRKAFRRNGQRLHKDLAFWVPDPGVSYGTVYGGKGYEFDTVILPGLGADHYPDPKAVVAEGEEEAQAQDARLLYVGVTRARQQLIMTCTGEPTSLLPEAGDLWVEQVAG